VLLSGLQEFIAITGNNVFIGGNGQVLEFDYRGNGKSEGSPEGAYYSPAYAVDDLNALTSIKKYKDADSLKKSLRRALTYKALATTVGGGTAYYFTH